MCCMSSSDSHDDSFGSSSVSLFTEFLSACFRVVSFLSALVTVYFGCRTFMQWCPVRSIAVSTRSVSKFLFFGFGPYRSILCIGFSFILCFSFVDIRASGIVFFLFFFSYVFRFINSIVFFISKVFYFIILSGIFLSVIAVMYFDISSSSAEIVLKLHSFSISINRLQKSSGVSSLVCFAQKKSPRLW